MNNLPPIGIIGKLRAGKDELAKYLVKNYGYSRYAFADELKTAYHKLFDEDPGAKPREGYVWFGETMRARDPEIWIRKCFDSIEAHREQLDFIRGTYGNRAPFLPVITDTRQLNEAQRLHSEGYVLIRVTCPDALRIDRAIKSGDRFDYSDLVHGTETELDDWPADYTVDNSGSLDELYAQIDGVMRTLEGADVA